MRRLVCAVLCACTHHPTTNGPRTLPTPSVQVGACGEPGRDGVISPHPRLEHADRDLDGDGVSERIVIDRAMCTPEGNCHWNVFTARGGGDCSRYVGTFFASALETLPARGDDNMVDVRGYYTLHGGRLLLQSYRFVRGGYQLVDTLICRRASDDKLDCAEDSQARDP